MSTWDLREVPTSGRDFGAVAGELPGRGNSPIRRAAIVPGSRRGGAASGRASINEANRCVAAPIGNPANLAASCHGSMSSRANADSTLRSMPFRSSPIGAKRKASNSHPRFAIEALRVISTTDFCHLLSSATAERWTAVTNILLAAGTRQARKLPKGNGRPSPVVGLSSVEKP